MKSSERIVVYSALIGLGAMNLMFLLSHTGQTALAETAAYFADVLGPAEAVKLVDEGKEMTVRNKGGRVAWGDGDFKQTYTMAFVDIGRVLTPLMDSPAFVEEREALRQELEPTDKDFQARVDEFGKQLNGLDPNSPEFREKYEAASKLYQEWQAWGREVALKKRNDLDVKHLQQAYRELTTAVNVVADKLGVDIVLRFIPPDSELKAVNAEQAVTEVRLRAAVKAPEKLDITTEVMQELSLQDKER